MSPARHLRKPTPRVAPPKPANRVPSIVPALDRDSEPRAPGTPVRASSMRIVPAQPEHEWRINLLSLPRLRAAIRSNRVSFPSQVPTFAKHDRPDLQRKVVQLYFVLGWSCSDIGARYGLIRQRVQQILSTWKRRATEMGYVQHIPLSEELGPVFTNPCGRLVSGSLSFGHASLPQVRKACR
jgi:hypothetical protein